MLRHDVTCDGTHGSYKGMPTHNRVSFCDEASRSQPGEGVAEGRSVSFLSQGTRVTVVTLDILFFRYTTLGNKLFLGDPKHWSNRSDVRHEEDLWT